MGNVPVYSVFVARLFFAKTLPTGIVFYPQQSAFLGLYCLFLALDYLHPL
jgi:hypothetical protein